MTTDEEVAWKLWDTIQQRILTALQATREDERESCAKEADLYPGSQVGQAIAANIRGRKYHGR